MWTGPANRKKNSLPAAAVTAGGLLVLLCACSANLDAIKASEQRSERKFSDLAGRCDRLEDSLAVQARKSADRDRASEKSIQSLADSLSIIKEELAQERKSRQMGDLNLDSQIALLADEIREFEQRMEQKLSGTAEPAPADPAPDLKLSSLDIKTAYNKGMQYFNRRQYAKAITAFTPISRPELNSDLADNAQYWIGECQYNLKQYDAALESFKKVFAFAKTNKDDDAQIKIAYTHLKLGDRAAALAAFKKFIEAYPYSEYIGDAERKAADLASRTETGTDGR